VFVKIVLKAAAIIAALHLPPNIVKAEARHLQKLAEELQAEFKKNEGMSLTKEEAQAIAKELLDYSDSNEKVDELAQAVSSLGSRSGQTIKGPRKIEEIGCLSFAAGISRQKVP